MRRVCCIISDYFYKKGIINFEDKNAFRFAIEVVITQLFTFVSILIIGYYMNMFYHTVIYCIYFVWARKVLEGYHAKTFLHCYIITILFYILVLFFMRFQIEYIYLNGLNIMLILIYMRNNKTGLFKLLMYLSFYYTTVFLFYYFSYSSLGNMCSLLMFAVLLVSKVGGISYGDSSD